MFAPSRATLLLALLTCACGAHQQLAPTAHHATATQRPVAGGFSSRSLGPSASFGDAVRLANALTKSHQGTSDATCLLRRESEGYSLSGDLMPALTELPDSPIDLDARLQRNLANASVLTAWGALPSGPPAQEAAFLLAAFTTVPVSVVRAPVAAFVLTDEGAYLRFGTGAAHGDEGPLPPDVALTHWLKEARASHGTLFVSAEAAVPMAVVASVLALIPPGSNVALAVVLPEGTRPPNTPGRPQNSTRLCTDGLPEPAVEANEGTLDADLVMQALAPLRASAERCLETVEGPARAGGRLTLALRIGADGHLQNVCMLRDSIGDAALADCVLDSAAALQLPAPNPPGFVDVHLPLLLAPSSTPAQRGLCE